MRTNIPVKSVRITFHASRFTFHVSLFDFSISAFERFSFFLMKSLLPDSSKYDLALQLKACQSHSRRNGKVARLPSALRDQINHLLDDGVPYKKIIESLGDAGKHINEDNLSNWRLGGYQDYLKAQAIADRARVQIESAAEVVRENGHTDPVKLQQVCSEVSLLTYLITLVHHGDNLTKRALTKNPSKFITLVNACCNASNAGLARDKFKRRIETLPSLLTDETNNEPNS